MILRKFKFFWNILFKSFSVPYCPLNLCKKIRKIFSADSKKKMLLTNGLTENTEFIGPFPSGVQFKMILRQLVRFVYTFLRNLTTIFNFHRCIMNTGRWLLVEELQNIVHRIFFDSQKQTFEDVFKYTCFPVNIAKFLRTPFFTEHLWWLLLDSQR